MIKNIVFDVGEVLLTYRWVDAVTDGGFSHEDAQKAVGEIFSYSIWHECFDRGTMNDKELMDYFIKSNPEFESIYKWFFAHPELLPITKPEIYEYLPKLKNAGYSLYILSDYSKYLSEVHFAIGDFLKYFDGGIISYQVGHVKPEPEIYKALLDKYDLIASECIFLDDRKTNIEGAIKIGMSGEQITSDDRLKRILENLLSEK